MEEKYSKQSIDRFLFIKEEMLTKLKQDNVKVYRYNGGELLELTSVQKEAQIVFFTDRLGDFVFIKNN